MNEHKRKELEDGFEEINRRLLRYAIWRAKQLFGHRVRFLEGGEGGPDAGLPGGKTVRDVIVEAILKLYDGTNSCPDHVKVLTCLRNNISRDLDHLANSKAGKEDLLPDNADEADTWTQRRGSTALVHVPVGPFQQAVDNETLTEFYCSLDGDQTLVNVLDALMAGNTPKETAEKLGMTVKDVQNAKKRLRRKLQPYRDAIKQR